jgi:uncharacterized protein HemY
VKLNIKPLEPPDSFHLNGAIGWLGLGNNLEANEELENISPQLRVHPDVLEIRWQILAADKQWVACEHIARTLTELAPSRPVGWIHLAYSLRRSRNDGLQSAWETLLTVAEKFPNEVSIPFNLACYACQLNRLDGARDWIKKAFDIGKKTKCYDQIRLMALGENDLEPLWTELQQIKD